MRGNVRLYCVYGRRDGPRLRLTVDLVKLEWRMCAQIRRNHFCSEKAGKIAPTHEYTKCLDRDAKILSLCPTLPTPRLCLTSSHRANRFSGRRGELAILHLRVWFSGRHEVGFRVASSFRGRASRHSRGASTNHIREEEVLNDALKRRS